MSENQQNMLNDWFENALDLLCIFDETTCLNRINPAWTKTTGWTEGELIGSQLVDFLHPEDVASMRGALQKVVENLSQQNIENRWRQKNGQYIWLSWNLSLSGLPHKAICASARDISTSKQKQIAIDNDVRLLELAEQTARIGHWRLDVSKGELQWSNEVYNIYGRRPNKAVITLDDFIDAFSGSHQKEFWSLIQHAINDGREISTELVLKRDDNERRTVAVRAVCEYDASGVVRSLFGILQDVTEERVHQASLRSKEELLSMAFRATSDGIWDWDLQTDQMWFSPQWKAQLGYEEDEISNSFESWANLIFDEDRIKAMDMMDAHFRGELDRFEMIQRFHHKKDHTVFILVRAYALRDEQGRAIRMIGAHTDVTELKQLEQAKSEFTSIVSHELRTPLTAIHGAIGLLDGHYGEELSEPARNLVRIAQNNSERLNFLVNDILDMDRLQSGNVTFSPSVIPLDSFLPQVIENHRSYAGKFKVDLDYDQSGDSYQILADPDRLMQVMANLVSNAIKFSHEGHTVKIRAHTRNDKIAISVIDTGRGIPRDMRDKIFNKFIQADSSDQRHKGGTGLGLTISKALLEKMNGTITVISKLDEGSTFTILLPRAETSAE
ncbi:PAS domain-containing protein [Terasakiella sp.]|uniref:PAS domain-containing sensor histidine kinase n=1 Tax=Terasakiella sp. TaxID=2034861 RepID=UPI003AA7CF1E